MNVSVPLVWANLGLLAILLVAKLIAKSVAVYPLARRWARPHAAFTTLLMSTGLTFGTISATYGYTAGIITRAEFSVLVCVVVLTAVVPTAIAQRWFAPDPAVQTEAPDVEDEEFEPSRTQGKRRSRTATGRPSQATDGSRPETAAQSADT
jgi:Kef-type K+ transport system membrane component KefB